MKLYRFGALSERLLCYLRDRQLYFQSPALFNDPYDCDLDALYLGPAEELSLRYEKFLAAVRQEVDAARFRARGIQDRYLEGEGPEERGHAHLERAATGYGLFAAKAQALQNALTGSPAGPGGQDTNTVEEGWSRLKSHILGAFGVVCFSASPANMLLWSHYAAGHRGIAIEYDAGERPIEGWKHYHYLPVRYMRRRCIDVLSEGYPEAFINLLTTKSPDWEYEREYRLITLRGPGFQPTRAASITGVILGARFLENPPALLQAFLSSLGEMQGRRRAVRKVEISYCRKVPFEWALSVTPLRSFKEVRQYLQPAL